jgi:UDP-glucuronate 4-epimerase
MQNTDVYKTYADIAELENLTDFCPMTKIEDGLELFLNWFKKYEKNK